MFESTAHEPIGNTINISLSISAMWSNIEAKPTKDFEKPLNVSQFQHNFKVMSLARTIRDTDNGTDADVVDEYESDVDDDADDDEEEDDAESDEYLNGVGDPTASAVTTIATTIETRPNDETTFPPATK